jgi:AcrR family transcriptional regulator
MHDDGTMPRPLAPQGRTGRPPVTSRAQILAGARQLIDRDGWEQLTIRKLAAELGVGPTTLYHHVRDKEDLLLLLITAYLDQVPHPELPSTPRDRIVTAAIAIHDSLAAWPWTAEVLTVDGFIARLNESALWFVEAILAGAVDHGCTPQQAVLIFRNMWYYAAGEILVRARTKERATPPDFDAFFSRLDESNLPQLTAVAHEWDAWVRPDTFAQGIEAVVDGLLAQALAT